MGDFKKFLNNPLHKHPAFDMFEAKTECDKCGKPKNEQTKWGFTMNVNTLKMFCGPCRANEPKANING